jgi:excisionase family DNA binding protein
METTDDFVTIQDAARYLGVSTQTLRRWDEEGKLKAVRRPASDYRYYKLSDLEPFRLEYQRAQSQTANLADFFQTAQFNIEENQRLREPQRQAHKAIREHFAKSGEQAILQIPVGCGKTGVIATLPFGIANGRVLVITPNLTIRQVVSEALDISSAQCFWNKTRVLDTVSSGPFAAVLDGPSANIHDCAESHFVVTNIQQLASSADRWLPQFPPNFFDMILVDEGHHNVAESWLKVFEKFPEAKAVSLTATPFRADGRALRGKIVYRYSYAKAMINGYIKQIHSVNFAPAEIYFTYKDDTHRHTLEEVLELREEAWFRKGVALAPECNKHIAEASIIRCMTLRNKTGLKHQIIAAACSIDHARQVRSIYDQLGMTCREIYSEMEPEKQERVLNELKGGKLDCIVQVQMLGEGFDHPPLSVAAVFRPFRSLSPYIQFVGRIMRVIHQDDPGHPDNHGYVVSHVGLNNDANWNDFRDVDFEDQEVFRKWIAAGEDEEEIGSGEGHPRRFDGGMLVRNEIISHFIGQSFLNPDDDRVLDEILAQKVAGTPLTVGDLTSRESLRSMLRQEQDEHRGTPKALPITPQRRRRASKKRLFERTNSLVARILRDLGLSPAGREISRNMKTGRGGNRAALTQLLNRAINDRLNIKSGQRNTLTAKQAEAAFGELDNIGDQVRDAIRQKIGG